MKILLDTHLIIWALTDSPNLPEKARELILTPENDIYFSVVSLWEIEIKRLAKPDSLPMTAKETYDYCKESGFRQIQLKENSIFKLSELSRPETSPAHKDPFDKILICQAIAEDMFFLTHDSKLIDYETNKIIFV